MKMRLIALVLVLAVAGVLATLGGEAWARGNADPLGIIATAATIPYFNADLSTGNVFVVLIASPVGDNGVNVATAPRSHLWFYDNDCVRLDSVPVPMSENDSEVVVLSDGAPSFLTLTEGSILIGGTTNNIDQVGLFSPIVLRGAWLDALNNRARYVDPGAGLVVSEATSEYIVDTAGENQTWSRYDSGLIISFAPPDDGSSFEDTVIFSCPLGTGPNTLAYDMRNSNLGGGWQSVNTGSNTLVFTNANDSHIDNPIVIQAAVYDLDENHIADWTAFCRCVGAKKFGTDDFISQIRLSTLSASYASNATYTEIRAASNEDNPDEQRFTGYWFYRMNFSQLSPPYDAELFGQLHHGHQNVLGIGINP